MPEAILSTTNRLNPFDLTGRVAVITGGAGLLGEQHAKAIAGAGGTPVLVDLSTATSEKPEQLAREFGVRAMGSPADITNRDDVMRCCQDILERFGRIDILINNAANNPSVNKS